MSTAGGDAPPRDSEREARTALLALIVAVAVVLSPPAGLIAGLLVAVALERRQLWVAGGAGLGLVALFAAVGLVDATWAAAWRQAAAAPGGLLLNGSQALSAA